MAVNRRLPARLRLTAEVADAGAALAQFISRRGDLPMPDARAAVERGAAFVDGKRVRDPLHLLRARALVEVVLRERGQAPAAPEPIGRERILHQDEQVVAVDKPDGVLAQEGRAGGQALPELVSQLLGSKLLLVHRLDRGTTGAALLARTRSAQAALLAAFRDGLVKKEYRALVAGLPAGDEGVIDLALGEDLAAPGRRKPDPRGESARTRWKVLERFAAAGGAALVAAFPETGRTHQIRVHLAAIGHPLLGDGRYGGPKALTRADGERLDVRRPLLHALAIALPHPAGGTLKVRAPEPPDLLSACAFLRLK